MAAGSEGNKGNTEKTNTIGTTAGTNKTSTDTASAATTRGRGRPAGSTTKQDKKLPTPVMVEIPGDSKPEDKPKTPARGRPAGSTTKKRTPAKKKADTTQLKILVLTLSGVMASRPGMDVWALQPEEVDQIIEPLSSILAKHNVGAATAEYADYIALIMSLVVIFLPKYLIYKQSKPKKEIKTNVISNNRPTNQPAGSENGTSTGSSNRNDKPSTDNDTTFGKGIHAVLPAIGQF